MMLLRSVFTLSLVVALAGVASAVTPTASPSNAAPEEAKKKIVFVHGEASHGYGGHAYGPAFRMLARILNENVSAVTAVVVQDNADLAVLDVADAIVLGSDGGRLVKSLGDRLEPLMEKGVGLACIHYTVDPTDPRAVARLIDWIGGAYEQHWSVNPQWEADFTTFPDHPVARGLEPFKAQDEWYYHMRFAKDMKGVTPILSAVPPESTRQRPDGPHSGNPNVRARKGMAEVVAWVYERPGGGRGFGFTGMHMHWTWAQDSFRKSVLNALVWIAGAEVPPGGVPSKTPTLEELEADLGMPRPKNFNADAVREKIDAKQKFSVGEPQTVISHERMKEVNIRGIDGSIYALNDNGQWKWFCTNLVRIVYGIGPRDNPFDSIVVKSELAGLPDAYTNTGFGFSVDHRWGDGPTLANVYLNPENGHIIGFFHTEWTLQTGGGTYFRLGLSISKDGGKSFEWCGYIIEPELSYHTWFNHWRGGKVGGHHPFANIGLANYVIKDGYFYLYYADARDKPDAFIQGTAVARAKVEDVLAAAEDLRTASWNKYYNGEWNERGLGGRFTSLNLEPRGFLHGDAAYNSYLDKFVIVTRYGKQPDGAPTNTAGSVLISFSKNGINWSDWQAVHEDNHLHDYPSIISTGDNNEVLGKSFWVYYKYCFNDVLPKWDWYTNRWDRVLVTME